MKKIRDNSAVPPGGSFNYRDPETGFELRSHAFHVLRSKAKSYRQLNNLPIGLGWDDQFEEIVCENTPRACMDFEPPTLLSKLGTLSRSLANAAKQWRQPVVTAEEWERRKSICEACNFYAGSTSLLKIACKHCGCTGLKLGLVSSRCPLNPPKW